MQFKHYTCIKTFYANTFDILMRHEAQNIIPLGNILIGNEGKDTAGWRNPANWFMATVSDATGILLTAVMTPPHNLTLYATDNINDATVLRCLIDDIKNAGVTIPGVMAEKSLAEMFADLYGKEYKIDTDQRIYELSQVNKDIPAIGTVRLAEEKDMSFLPYWINDFFNECFGDPLSVGGNAEQARYHLNSGRLYVLEDNGVPVSIAKLSRELITVCAIGLVYTPPYLRGKGYASACVATVSQIGLDKGFKKCVLYTDLANPTSNSIYKKIGYVPIADSLDIKF